MKAFIEYVVKALVDHPEEVTVTEVDGERVVVFELRLNQTDVGKVIGKSGRTITAIRTLLTSSAAKQGKRAMLEIIEPGRERGRPSGGEPHQEEPPPTDDGGEASDAAPPA